MDGGRTGAAPSSIGESAVVASFGAAVRSLQVVKLSNPLSENHKWLVRHNDRTNGNAGGDDVDDDDDQGCQMAKFDPFLSLDCARVEGVGAQSKERKGSNFAA